MLLSFVRNHAGKVYAVGLKYLRSPFAAQDVVQEIFLKVWKTRAELPAVENFTSFLYIMSRNFILNSLRKKMPVSLEEDQDTRLQEQILVPDEQLGRKELAGLIRQAIENLPPQQQKVYR